MVRPTSASLNSLAEVVRQAQPLYAECRSILSYLETGVQAEWLPRLEDLVSGQIAVEANEDGESLHPTVLEPVPRSRNSIM